MHLVCTLLIQQERQLSEGPGHSVNRRTLKTKKLLSSSPSPKSALTCHYVGDVCRGMKGSTMGAKIITHTTFIVGEIIFQLQTHQLHNSNCRGINLCNACVSLVSACLASMISQTGNYTTIMLMELISNYTHTTLTTHTPSIKGVEVHPLN